MLWNGSSARAYRRADKAVLLQDPVRPWLYPRSRTSGKSPCRNEQKTQSGELARGKGTAHLHQTTFHYNNASKSEVHRCWLNFAHGKQHLPASCKQAPLHIRAAITRTA